MIVQLPLGHETVQLALVAQLVVHPPPVHVTLHVAPVLHVVEQCPARHESVHLLPVEQLVVHEPALGSQSSVHVCPVPHEHCVPLHPLEPDEPDEPDEESGDPASPDEPPSPDEPDDPASPLPIVQSYVHAAARTAHPIAAIAARRCTSARIDKFPTPPASEASGTQTKKTERPREPYRGGARREPRGGGGESGIARYVIGY